MRIDRVVLRHRVRIAHMCASACGGIPAGKILPAAACRREGGISAAVWIAQNGVAAERAAVRVKDQITERRLADTGIAAVKEKLDFSDAAVQALLRKIAVRSLDPCTKSIGKLHVGIASAADHALHQIAGGQDRAAVSHNKINQRVKLRLCHGNAIGGAKRIDAVFRIGKLRRATVAAAHHLVDKGDARLTRPKTLRCACLRRYLLVRLCGGRL